MCRKCNNKVPRDKVDIALDISLSIFAFIMIFAIFAKMALLLCE